MIRKYFIIAVIFIARFGQGQDIFVFNPYQLALNSSLARVSGISYANNAATQSYFRDNYVADLSVYLPFNGLSDGSMNMSAAQIYSPSFAWGALGVSFAQFAAENLDKDIFSSSSLQISYVNAVFDHLILGAKYKWDRYSWRFDEFGTVEESGTALDMSTLLILDGHFSAGLSVKNLIRSPISSSDRDAPQRRYRGGLHWSNYENTISVEAGGGFYEDITFEYKPEIYINTVLSAPFGLQIGAEYVRNDKNELGVFLAYQYQSDLVNVKLAYGIRIDDAPIPVSTMRQSWGIQISLDKWRREDYAVNPQILLRDETAPSIFAQRLGDFTLFTQEDTADKLKIKTQIEDGESGLAAVSLVVRSESDSTSTLYQKTIYCSGHLFTDTLSYDGLDTSGIFIENKRYLAKIQATDFVGNKSESVTVPFRVLSRKNDAEGPLLAVEYDTTAVVLEAEKTDHLLMAKVDVDDKKGDWVLWRVQLYKSENDSNWKALKPVTGGIEIHGRTFKWLLRRSPLTALSGSYKIKVEANDELDNYAVAWSNIKRISQPGYKPQVLPLEAPQIASVRQQEVPAARRDRNQRREETEPSVVYLPEREATVIPTQETSQYSLNASYLYKNQNIKLSNFVFEEGREFDGRSNLQSLSMVGLYLQDLPGSKLITEYPGRLSSSPSFEKKIRQFFEEVYGISASRLEFKKSSMSKSLHFIIRE